TKAWLTNQPGEYSCTRGSRHPTLAQPRFQGWRAMEEHALRLRRSQSAVAKREAVMSESISIERAEDDLAKSLDKLKEDSKDLKAKIEQEKRRLDLPVDSKLGNPEWERSVSDGHLDLPEEDEN
ncbi:hypothetical protein, partial [Rhodoblastus sp.]|uniref:hypothetical protein n=1 Tax=Rhodoblastus sp. TaxID=1962975 RepID=UPI003F9B95CD